MINQASNAFVAMDGKNPVTFVVSLKTDKWRSVTFDLKTGHMIVDGQKTEIVYSTGPQPVPVQKYGQKYSRFQMWWNRFKARWGR